jgi:GNAT superfamily N-acetyltransferase
VIRYDAHFGNGGERPDTLAALRHEAGAMLAGPEPWMWLAERDGEAIGLLAAQRPERAGWIAPLVRQSPPAYLMLMFVAPGERAAGIGTALVARLHADIGAAGVPVTLLHYEQVNPLSAPFWSQQGYRPLWITWEARPARAIR